MSRQSTAAQRNLTLTEELEKLEQSITLTLQEIDHNFSRAHRIVTTSILPIVDQYAEHSKNVWEGSKFWKQFFEASANVSLSGYEEPPAEDESVTEDDTATPSTSTFGSPPDTHEPTVTAQGDDPHYNAGTFSPTPEQETPRPKPRTTKKGSRKEPSTAPYSSPYESLKRDMLPSNEASPSDSELPSTPPPRLAAPEHSQSPPFVPPSTAANKARRTPANDVLLHRVLDKNWRIQATPHSTARLPHRPNTDATPKASPARRGHHGAAKAANNDGGDDDDDDDLGSSPLIAAPQLHSEIFGSPVRKGRVPGVSVLTPAKGFKQGGGRTELSARREAKTPREGNGNEKGDMWDSDSEGEEVEGGGGMSPPKTMQFHVPQAKLMRTPAREASKRIVEDLLLSAGGNVSEDPEDDSPSVVRRGGLLEEDTF